MKIICFSVVTFIFLFIEVSGQKSNKDYLFSNYNYSKAYRILDSIWLEQKLWQNAGITDIEHARLVKLIIIPIFDFTENANEYRSNDTFLDYLKIDDKTLSALIVYDKSFIGYIKVYYSERKDSIELKQADTTQKSFQKLINEVSKNNNTLNGWYLSTESAFSNNHTPFRFWGRVHTIIIERNLKNYFTLPIYAWDFWFLEFNKLKAFSVNTQNVVDEKQLIKSIRNMEVNGNICHYLEYIN
jgi:hypothetical protein